MAPVKKIEPRPARDHVAGGFAAGEEAGVARHLPHLAEHALGGFEQGEVDVASDIEDDDLERRDGVGLGHQGGDVLLFAGIGKAGVADAAGFGDFGDERCQFVAAAAGGEDDVAFGCEAADNGGTDIVPGADDHGGRIAWCWRHVSLPLPIITIVTRRVSVQVARLCMTW